MSDDDHDRHYSRPVWPSDAPKHNGCNHEEWKKILEPFLRHYSDPGSSIDDGINRIPKPPLKDDTMDADDFDSDYKYQHFISLTFIDDSSTTLIDPNSSMPLVLRNYPHQQPRNGTD